MYQDSYQGGPLFEVFTASGQNPLSNLKISGTVKKLFDKSVRGYVYECDSGGAQNRMSLPKDEKKGLGLIQPCLCVQLYVPQSRPFSLEINVQDAFKTRRRLLFSTACKETVANPLHTRIPATMLRKGVWVNLCFDMEDLMRVNFNQSFHSIEAISIGPVCKIRRIFTLLHHPSVGDGDSADLDNSVSMCSTIPPSVDFPIGAGFEYCTQVVTMDQVHRLQASSSEELPAPTTMTHTASSAPRHSPATTIAARKGISTANSSHAPHLSVLTRQAKPASRSAPASIGRGRVLANAKGQIQRSIPRQNGSFTELQPTSVQGKANAIGSAGGWSAHLAPASAPTTTGSAPLAPIDNFLSQNMRPKPSTAAASVSFGGALKQNQNTANSVSPHISTASQGVGGQSKNEQSAVQSPGRTSSFNGDQPSSTASRPRSSAYRLGLPPPPLHRSVSPDFGERLRNARSALEADSDEEIPAPDAPTANTMPGQGRGVDPFGRSLREYDSGMYGGGQGAVTVTEAALEQGHQHQHQHHHRGKGIPSHNNNRKQQPPSGIEDEDKEEVGEREGGDNNSTAAEDEDEDAVKLAALASSLVNRAYERGISGGGGGDGEGGGSRPTEALSVEEDEELAHFDEEQEQREEEEEEGSIHSDECEDTVVVHNGRNDEEEEEEEEDLMSHTLEAYKMGGLSWDGKNVEDDDTPVLETPAAEDTPIAYNKNGSHVENEGTDECDVELLYDAQLRCYYDPTTGKYYE